MGSVNFTDVLKKRLEEIRGVRDSLDEEMRQESEVYRAHSVIVEKLYGEGKKLNGLDPTVRLLVSLGIVIHSGTEAAIEWTLMRAIEQRVSEVMIRDVIDVAILTGGGLAVSNARFAFGLLKVCTKA
jgi:alkylhydroperoxidase/carboxymuconolactone decarboxylase family protein YurZ